MIFHTQETQFLLSRLAGQFIAFDGVGGSGKSTIVGKLAGWLRQQHEAIHPAMKIAPDRGIFTVREPGGTAYGERIREILIDPDIAKTSTLTPEAEAMLFMAARSQLVNESVFPLTQMSGIVLADRWASSTFAYQGGVAGLDWMQLVRLYDFAVPLYRPQMVYILDVSGEVAVARQKERPSDNRFHHQPASYYEKARAGYLRYAQTFVARTSVIDASGTLDETFDKVLTGLKIYVAAGVPCRL